MARVIRQLQVFLLLAAVLGQAGALTVAKAAVQTITGTIVGRIVDPADAAIPGVLVRFENLANGFSYASKTSTDGTYRMEFLPPGAYRITAARDGFQTGGIERYLVEVNRTKEITPPPIRLVPIGGTKATGTAADDKARLQVNAVDPTHRSSADHDFLAALPLQGFRSVDAVALLAPGVTPAPATFGTTGPGLGSGIGTPGQFSVNGQRARNNNFTIDGSDNNDQDVAVRRQGFVVTASEPTDAVKEFVISTLLSDAEAGRNSGGQVNIVTRTGSNAIDGRAYGLFTDSHLNARDFFDYSGELPGLGVNPEKNPFTRLQAGAVLSAPLSRDRALVFVAYEGLVVNRADEVHFVTPTEAERKSALATGAAVRRASRLGLDVLLPTYYPTPNDPGGPYADNTVTEILNGSAHGSAFILRVEGQFGLLGKPCVLSGRYSITDDTSRISSVDRAINGSVTARTRTQNAAFALNTILSDTVSNQARFSYGRTANNFDAVDQSPLVFDSLLGKTGPIGRLLIEPYSPLGVDPFTFPQGRASNTYQFADTAVYAAGNWIWKFGSDIRRVQLNSFLDRNYRVQLAFTPGLISASPVSSRVGSAIEFAGLGLPSGLQQSLAIVADSTLGLRFTESSLFVQASWRARPGLTLMAGLRYEYNTVPTDSTGRLERYLAIEASTLPIADPDAPGVDIFLESLAAQQTVLGGREKIYDPDGNNFAPRLGLAWDLRGDGRMSVRAGYGLFYDTILGSVVNQSRNVFPAFLPANFAPSQVFFPDALSANPALIEYNGQPLLVPGSNVINLPIDRVYQTLGILNFVGPFELAFTLPDKALRSPYVHQYSVSYEAAIADRYVASVAYVGTSGHKLIRYRTPNGGAFAPLRYINPPVDNVFSLLGTAENPKSNATLGSYSTFESSANQSYNALQLSLVRRDTDGLAFQIAYTYGHAIDDVSDVNDTAGAYRVALDELNRDGGLRLERGDAGYDVRHRFSAAFSYDLPFWRDRPILGGIAVAGVVTLQSGQPFTVNTSVDTNFDGNATDRLNSTDGLTLLDGGRTRIVATRPLYEYLAAFGASSASVGRNTFRAAGVASIDLALTKRCQFGESQALQIRVEGFNVLNRTHFGVPVRILESPGFGSSTTSSVSSRTIQFVLGYEF